MPKTPSGVNKPDYDELIELLRFWCELFEIDDRYYAIIINEFRKQSIEDLDVKAVVKYILRFLDFMNMGRQAWSVDPNDLLKAIQGSGKDISRLRGLTLVSADLEAMERQITDTFAKLVEVKYVGPTSASKILHILQPDLFVMYDEPIRKAYHVRDSPSGYFRFLQEMQALARGLVELHARKKGLSLRKAERDLSREFQGKPITKLLDEYNWLMYTFKLENVKYYRKFLT